MSLRSLRNLAGLALAFALLGHAGSASALCNNIMCRDEKVTKLYLRAEGLSIKVSGDMTLLDCNLGTEGFVKLSKDDPLFSHYLSMLLAAELANRPITLRINSSAETGGVRTDCTLRYIQM